MVTDPALPTCGLADGDYVGMLKGIPISIEGQGFYLATIVIGVERGWITRDEGRQRAVRALNQQILPCLGSVD